MSSVNVKPRYERKPVEKWLNEVDYTFAGYMPKDEALMFVNFIKEVNAGSEENETPVVHLKMMDSVFNTEKRCAILCHRGIGKTTLFAEYLILFNAAFGYIPGFGKTNLILYVTDSIENGVKNLRRNVEFRYSNSEFLQKLIPNRSIKVGSGGTKYVDLDEYEEDEGGRKFTDIRLEFMNNKGHRTVVKGYGSKALSLDSKLFTKYGTTTIGDCKIGEKIYGPDGRLATILEKSEVFNKPMYKIILEDGRTIKVSEDHINSIVHKENVNNIATYTKKDLYTTELLKLPLQHIRKRTRVGKSDYISRENLLFIENTKALMYETRNFTIEPYLLGLLLGDGSMKKDGSCVLHAHKDDMDEYIENIDEKLGSRYVDKRNTNVISQSILGLSKRVRDLGVNVHGNVKFIPEVYMYGSIEQRLDLLRGLLDTDGTVSKDGRISFSSNSIKLIQGVNSLVRSLGGTAKHRKVTDKAYSTEIWIDMLPFKLKRKVVRFKPKTKNLVAITSIERIEDEASQCISIDNKEHQFLTEDYVRTHNTGVRGAKEMGQRPTLAILDDLVSDTDAESAAVIKTIENTVYKAVSKALSPTKQKMIWLGTPFNAKDPLYKAVESGAWRVSVYPICERFPVPEEEFRGSWEDRFTYEYVSDEYAEAEALGMPQNFNQELMLRIMSNDDRVVQDDEIQWYSRLNLMKRKDDFNFYITTDFATSSSESSDYSVISVWALNSNHDWFWVDGVCKKQLMDKNIDYLFAFVSKYRPLSVGVEISGQQGGFIAWIKKEMLNRNIYFSLASDKGSSKEGIRPSTNKLTRFMSIQPLFKNHKMYFPEERKNTPEMLEMLDELRNLSVTGFKSKHDDFSDTISMLTSINAFPPTTGDKRKVVNEVEDLIYNDDEEDDEYADIDSYVV